MENDVTFTDVQHQVIQWILEVEYDLKQDWNNEKTEMQLQLQSLYMIKANLDYIQKTGNQIFRSSIKLTKFGDPKKQKKTL